MVSKKVIIYTTHNDCHEADIQKRLKTKGMPSLNPDTYNTLRRTIIIVNIISTAKVPTSALSTAGDILIQCSTAQLKPLPLHPSRHRRLRYNPFLPPRHLERPSFRSRQCRRARAALRNLSDRLRFFALDPRSATSEDNACYGCGEEKDARCGANADSSFCAG
ncbi:hypothetical protein BJY04DRAFT_200409 [Aspergillus karnatakaensis]|uniref:uncharacterized protein n=1 Tax=Aspergillus karnatakaensis TaxID=1810916 RepID=UPI003CCDED44